ncbi:hypothetical protein D3C75_1115040 [compost metagenome]
MLTAAVPVVVFVRQHDVEDHHRQVAPGIAVGRAIGVHAGLVDAALDAGRVDWQVDVVALGVPGLVHAVADGADVPGQRTVIGTEREGKTVQRVGWGDLLVDRLKGSIRAVGLAVVLVAEHRSDLGLSAHHRGVECGGGRAIRPPT